MTDCSKTENYFAEKARMTKRQKCNHCGIKCYDCPLSDRNNGVSESISCMGFELLYPKKAIAIMQEWSNKHQKKTYLSEFLKSYPKVQISNSGIPKSICLSDLGLISRKDCANFQNCVECWNQPLREGEE